MKHLWRAAAVLALCAPWAGAGEAEREPTTGLLGAMGSEVRMLLDQLEHAQEQRIEGVRFWTGRLRGRRVAIAMTGVGKVNAAITATLLHVHFHPAEVLFTGIAGGVNPDLKPGDIVVAAKTVQHDFGTLTAGGLTRKGARNPITRDRNPLFFPADARLLRIAGESARRVALGAVEGDRVPRVIQGVVATGDVFVALGEKRRELRKQLGADAVEMEGAAVAQACWQWRVPCLVIRSLSDMADRNAVRDVKAFLRTAAANSATLVIDIVAHIE